LSTLPKNLKNSFCSNNQLTCLPTLPKNLEILSCNHNQLTSLPTLPQNLELLSCNHNQLTYLPTLPQNLEVLSCIHNQLTYLPTLPQNLKQLSCDDNPIYNIVNSISLFQIKQKLQLLNNVRYLYSCLKFKKPFRKWLWEKVREPTIMKKYHPNYLIENLRDEDNLDDILNNWK
jgi:hypothetical protein